MAGFFGLFDYTKEGPGIDPNEPEKGAIGEYFSILGTKFWRLIVINLMMIGFHLLAIALSFFLVNWLVPLVFPAFSFENIVKAMAPLKDILTEGVTVEAYSAHLFMNSMLVFSFLMVGLQFFVVGPFQAGFTYLFRNISRREPAFTWMDFIDTAKKNWKQGLIHSIISAIVVPVIAMAYFYYGTAIGNGMLAMILRSFVVIAFVIFSMMQFYIYQLMITFDLKMKDIYRNAFLLTFLRLPSNFAVLILNLIFLLVIPMLIVWLLPSGITTLILIALYALLFLAWMNYLVNFQANRQIQRFVMSKDDDDDDEGGSLSESSEYVEGHATSSVNKEEDTSIGEEVPEGSPSNAPA